MHEKTFEEKVHEFWHLSSIYHGRISKYDGLTVEKAIDLTGQIIRNLNPERRLWGATFTLQRNIISYGPAPRRRKKSDPKAVVLDMQVKSKAKTNTGEATHANAATATGE